MVIKLEASRKEVMKEELAIIGLQLAIGWSAVMISWYHIQVVVTNKLLLGMNKVRLWLWKKGIGV